MNGVPITAVDERGRQFKEKKLRNALRVADVGGADSMDLRTLGFVFASAELDPNDFIKTSGLTDPDKDTLNEKSEALQSAVDAFRDISENGHDGNNRSGFDHIRDLYDQKNKREGRHEAAQHLRDSKHLATHKGSERLRRWNPETKILDDDGEKFVGEILVNELGPHHSRHEEKEIIQKVKRLTYQDEFGGAFVPVANGDLFIDPDDQSVTLKDADPERAPLSRSPAEWRENAECPNFAEYLVEAVPNPPEQDTLQEYAGFCLMHWAYTLHKALFIVGPTASGKSTFLMVLRHLLGTVASVSPQQLVNDRFGAIELEGAWANIRSDISAAVLQDIGKFKEILAGEPLHVERKHEQGYTLEPTAKHLYSANRLPNVSIDDDAFFRRILLVSFPETVPREDRDPKLPEKLKEEIDGILVWAVQGLQRVLKNEGFTHDRDPQDTRRQWEEHSSSIGRFKAAALDVTGDHDNDVETKEATFTAYTEFCQSKGLSTETQQQLTSRLKEDSRIRDGKRTPSYADSQARCYTGIQIREEWHPEPDAPF